MYTTRVGWSVRIPERYTNYLCVLALTKYKFGYKMDICAQVIDDIYLIDENICLFGPGLEGGFKNTLWIESDKIWQINENKRSW